MHVVVTGAAGFLGRHVTALLAFEPGVTVGTLTVESPSADWERELTRADAVIHLAGVNRPTDDAEFTTGNMELTRAVAAGLARAGRRAPLVLSSSTRAVEDTPYGRSKLGAEEAVREYAANAGAPAAIYRLPNVFGKWSQPFYNSAVATFCHSIARDLPVTVHDDARVVRLAYGEDVAHALIAMARSLAGQHGGVRTPEVQPQYERTLGGIVGLLREFRALRTDLRLPDLSDPFARKLYATYVSFIPLEDMAYALTTYTDERGALAELLKSPWFGQVFVSRTRPGITRGNHFHHTKSEKFVVVEGDAVIRMRPVEGGPISAFRVAGPEFRVVDIPPGYTHDITNVGECELVTLFWSSEIFDRDRPDTFALQVDTRP